MYNSEIRGSDAYYAMEEFVTADNSLESARGEMESAAENACTVISQLTDDLEEKEDNITALQGEVNDLEEKLKSEDAAEFIRVLRNVQVYVADHIEVLEKKYGQTLDAAPDQQE